MKAADIMTTEVATIDSLATLDRAAKVMKQHDLKTLIVERASDSDAYGIITATDLTRAIANAKDPATTYVCEVMTKPCIVVSPNLAVEHIVNLFAKAKIRVAPVIKDKLIGIVSLTDIINKTNYLTATDFRSTTYEADVLADLPFNEAIEKEWETVDWERDYDNWCSG